MVNDQRLYRRDDKRKPKGGGVGHFDGEGL